jgi:hypothetical protein
LIPGGERGRLLLQPAGVGGAGPARNDVKEASVQVPVGISGQVDHPGHRLILVADPGRPPDVLVDAEDLDPVQAGRVGEPAGGFGLDHVPAGVPAHAEVAGQCRDRRVVEDQCVGRPLRRSGGQLRRGGTRSCRSVNTPVQQPGSRHRHSRASHANRTGNPNTGASATTRRRRP